MLTAIHDLFPMEDRNVDFSKTEPYSVQNRLLMKYALKGRLEGKDYLPVVAGSPFVGNFADRFFGGTQQHYQTTAHTM